MFTMRATSAAARVGVLLAAVLPALVAAEDRLVLRVCADRVARFEKVELVIEAAGPEPYQNPCDPDEVKVDVAITSPSGRLLTIPAFWYQPFERKRVPRGGREGDWFYPSGKAVWLARFAPEEVGVYQAVAGHEDRRGKLGSAVARFACAPSERKGFLRISRNDPRFLEFSDGSPFFALGQNLAFIGETQYASVSRAEAIFDKLAAQGANYLRIWTCCEDWAMAIEARKSAWGRSWAWAPPLAPAPGAAPGRQCVKLAGADGATLNAAPSHPVAVRPDTRYVLSAEVWAEEGAALRIQAGRAVIDPSGSRPQRWTTVRGEFTTGPDEFWLDHVTLRLQGAGAAYLDKLSLRESAGGPELLWEADVNRPLFGHYNPTDCMWLDALVEAAERRGLYLQLCVMTRDQYMRLLKKADSPEYQEAIRHAKKLFRYLVARWGYSTSVAAWEYFNELDPGLPTDRFYDELGEYLDEIDGYRHLRTTSAWAPAPKDYRHRRIDMAQPHYYLRPADKKKIRDEVSAVLDQVRFVREHAAAKPALLGEFGLADDQWRSCDDMKKDRQYVHFHNALWASALSGTSGTALFWWWEDIDAKNAYRHYRPLATWLADVPFTTAGLREAAASVSRGEVRLVGLQGSHQAYLWLLHPEATWADHLEPDAKPSPLRGLTLRVKGLAAGSYRVQWWDTWEGKAIREEDGSAVDGALDLLVPPFDRDLACKILAAR